MGAGCDDGGASVRGACAACGRAHRCGRSPRTARGRRARTQHARSPARRSCVRCPSFMGAAFCFAVSSQEVALSWRRRAREVRTNLACWQTTGLLLRAAIAVELAAAACTRPADTAGYVIGAEQLDPGAFSVDVACTTGYEGTPTATSCAQSGPYALSGCTPIRCVRPADISGYAQLREVNLDLSVGTFAVSASCAAGYVSGNRQIGTGIATACTTSLAEYALTGCSACGAGQSKAGHGSGECEPCGAGRYNPNSGSGACIDCPAGTYVDVAQADDVGDCIGCPRGKYVEMTGSNEPSDCISCTPGQYTAVIASASCVGCGSGRYAALAGNEASSDCIHCTAGTFSNATGAASCYSCPQGTYSPGTASPCRECPAGRSDADFDPATPCSSPMLCAAIPNEERCLQEVCAWEVEQAKCWTIAEALAQQREQTQQMTFVGLAAAAGGVATICCCYYIVALRPKVDRDKWAQRIAVQHVAVDDFAGTVKQSAPPVENA